MNLINVDMPSFILNPPFSLDTKYRNNIWMENFSEEYLKVNKERAYRQWFDLYSHMVSDGCLVTVLPTPKDCDLQDLTYVANMAVIINDTVVVSNFTSEPRIGETKIGVDFFSLAGFEKVVVCPFKFEGEADLKHIRDNLWVGGYGQRTDIAAFDWMEKEFNIKIIKMQMTDPALYHFDCGFFPLTKKEVMLCTEAFSKVEVDNLREYCTIIDVPYKMAKYGAVNSVRVHRMIYNNSDICELDPITQKDFYEIEIEKNNWMSKTLIEYGMEVRFVNLSEFMKSGALASCLVMHVNRWSYDQELL